MNASDRDSELWGVCWATDDHKAIIAKLLNPYVDRFATAIAIILPKKVCFAINVNKRAGINGTTQVGLADKRNSRVISEEGFQDCR